LSIIGDENDINDHEYISFSKRKAIAGDRLKNSIVEVGGCKIPVSRPEDGIPKG
jgi:hypothetical protein